MLPKNPALSYLFSLSAFGIKPGLKRTRKILKELGNPQDTYPSILIAGTNGKGSTSAMLSSVLLENGLKVGVYTSPHISRFNERISISGRVISDKDLIRLINYIRNLASKVELTLTFFEFTTAMAFEYFKEKGVEVAVVEVGMGGSLDSTNVLKPAVSVITSISKDHTEYLGSTIDKIAREKSGIIKGPPTVVGKLGAGALKVVRSKAKETTTRLYEYGRDFSTSSAFDYLGIRNIKALRLTLKGAHQVRNAAVAIRTYEELSEAGLVGFSVGAVRRGLKHARWPGRLEVVSGKPRIILDAAHNPEGAGVLADALKRMGLKDRGGRLIAVTGVMEDKDISGIFREVIPLADTVIVTRPEIERSALTSYLNKTAIRYCKDVQEIPQVGRALSRALKLASRDDLILVFGSIYTISEARSYLLRKGLLKGRS